jgi:hypothetical protein
MITAQYIPHTAKALEVILWLAKASPEIDIYHVVKAAFYADKYHVNKYGRPISGDEYQADMYGPLGQCIYGLLKHEPLKMLALDTNGPLPFTLGSKWRVFPEREANARLLSESDIEALGYGLEQVRGKSFDDLVRMTHDERAYLEANGGRMKYEDLLEDDDPHREAKATDLAETARNTVF